MPSKVLLDPTRLNDTNPLPRSPIALLLGAETQSVTGWVFKMPLSDMKNSCWEVRKRMSIQQVKKKNTSILTRGSSPWQICGNIIKTLDRYPATQMPSQPHKYTFRSIKKKNKSISHFFKSIHRHSKIPNKLFLNSVCRVFHPPVPIQRSLLTACPLTWRLHWPRGRTLRPSRPTAKPCQPVLLRKQSLHLEKKPGWIITVKVKTFRKKKTKSQHGLQFTHP